MCVLIRNHRSRRVKCDETKPSCMRCILAAKECLGYLYGRSPAASPESDSTDSNTGQVEDALVKLDLAESQPRGYRQQSTNFNIPMELLPKEWHFAESRSFSNVHHFPEQKGLIEANFLLP